MKRKLQLKIVTRGIITLSLFFVGCLVSVAHAVTYTNSNPMTDMLTISDTESGIVDIANSEAYDMQTCYADAASIQIVGGGTEATICANDGVADPIDVEVVGSGVGSNSGWVITDQATGEILGLPPGPPFDLEGVFAGVCDVWYIRYEDGLSGLMGGNNIADLSGCYDLSNPVSIIRLTDADCDSLSVDEFDSSFDFDLYPNPTRDNVNILFGGTRALDIEIQVIDMLGKLVYRTNVTNENSATINISNLENGTYFMNITDLESGNRIIKRVIKN